MNVLTVLLVILLVLVVSFAAFVGVQRRRRSSGVIAAKPRRARKR